MAVTTTLGPEPLPALRCFALRRLNPFLGTLQVLELPEARALSADGLLWHLELLARRHLALPLWDDSGTAGSEARFFRFGSWSARGGLTRLPVNSILGDQTGHPALTPLLRALERLPPLPFALADPLELWLLDADDQPLALVQSRRLQDPLPADPPLPWRALAATGGRPDGIAPAILDRAERAAALVRGAAGTPPQTQWLLRQADGAGQAQGGRHDGRRWPAAAFPELLVREHWVTPADQDLEIGRAHV
jgi:hypothetical protein